MVFSSLLFIFAFLPLNLLLYFAAKNITVKNIILLIFSLVFYAWGEPVYVFLLIGTAFFCWLFSRLLDKSEKKAVRRLWLFLSCAVCLGSIGFFKYSAFLVENLNAAAGKALLPVPQIALPIGISFYTFQLLTYVIDVYRKEVPSQKAYWKVLLYAGLFHQCVAGPIVRYGDVAQEIENRKTDPAEISRGITRFAFGLAKKAIFANGCGAAADVLLLTDASIGDAAALAENTALLTGRSALTLWAGMAFYMLQIYLDFSAYSDMAIGMGLMCGFHYKENFDYPYMSASVTEFWRRWHISLGSFFRDYVYIPLGGNRKGKARQILNLFVVWALTGLWHGASWNFVLWGLYFFVLLIFEKFLLLKRLRGGFFSRLYLLTAVYFGWVLFKFTDLSLLAAVLKGMFTLNGNSLFSFEAGHFLSGYLFFFTLSCLACTPVLKRFGEWFRKRGETNRAARFLGNAGEAVIPAVLTAVSALALVGDSYNPFLYFQF